MKKQNTPGARRAILPSLLLAACGSGDPVNDSGASSASGPTLTVKEATLADALHCPPTFTSVRDPVLLVHGTGGNGDLVWGSGLVPVLEKHGYDACTVDLPYNSFGDVQTAAQYVVYAARDMARRSGKQVSIVGHSQGVMQVNWALKWWPDVAAATDEVIGVSGCYHGTELTDNICAPGLCPPAAWQMDPQSQFLAAMNRDDETPGAADFTSIYSMTDTNVPFPSPVLNGARNLAVQDVCPGRKVKHMHMVVDAASLALVLDALGHAGPADPARIDPAVCNQDEADGVDVRMASYKENVLGAVVYGATIASAGVVPAEPPLDDYAH